MSSDLLLFSSFSGSFGRFVSSLSSQSGKSISLFLSLNSSVMLCFDSLFLGLEFSFPFSESGSGSFLLFQRSSLSFLSQSFPFLCLSLGLGFSCFSFSSSFCSKLSDQSLLLDFLFKILLLFFGKSLCLLSSSLSFFSFFLGGKSSLFIIFSFGESQISGGLSGCLCSSNSGSLFLLSFLSKTCLFGSSCLLIFYELSMSSKLSSLSQCLFFLSLFPCQCSCFLSFLLSGKLFSFGFFFQFSLFFSLSFVSGLFGLPSSLLILKSLSKLLLGSSLHLFSLSSHLFGMS